MAVRPNSLTEVIDSHKEGPVSRPGHEWQELWFAAIKRTWSSLVVVPAHRGGSALEVATQLANVAELHRAIPVKMINAEGAELTSIAAMILQMASHVSSGGLVIVALSSVFDNQASIPLALAADAALLCVTYRVSDLPSAEKTLQAIGRERFIGSVTLEPHRA